MFLDSNETNGIIMNLFDYFNFNLDLKIENLSVHSEFDLNCQVLTL